MTELLKYNIKHQIILPLLLYCFIQVLVIGFVLVIIFGIFKALFT